ncbi:MAG: NPCBM/NEW2 domain-containing protein, partial [Turicibacter sp.]|nr:NPCBM/NEW2 domain-containing protein [Turicibacter sp.]
MGKVRKKTKISLFIATLAAIVLTTNSVNANKLIRKQIENEISESTESMQDLTSADYIHLSDLGYVKSMSKTAWKNIMLDTNINGDPIEMIIDGEAVTFDKGITAHATSTLVFDLTDYSDTYTRFTTYAGINSHAAGKGNGVKFSVMVSNDGEEWEEIFVTEPINGNNDTVFIDVDVTGAKYLKLYADDNGANGNDQAAYALPRIMKSDYDLSSEKPQPTLPFDERLVQYVYLSDIGYLPNLSQTGWGNIVTDANLNNEKISLIIDGETVVFEKGLTAHATSSLVFNVSDYSQTYSRFTTYVGVDSSQAGKGNGVKFSVLTSNDGKEWEEIFITEPINGDNDTIFIDVDITGVKYLKLYAHDNGKNGNDHAVYAAPRVMKADYDLEKERTTPSNPYEDAVLKYIYLSDLGYVTSMSKTAWKKIMLDTNLDGDPITLNIDGEASTFDKGITAHATSTLVFDVSQYSDTYSRFTAYAGINSNSAGKGNGVKFSVFTSNDGKEWEEIFITEPINGNNDTVFIDVDITGVKYLKLYADDNGANGNDHSVYADARIMKSDYDLSSEQPQPTFPFDENIVQYLHLSDIGYLTSMSKTAWRNITLDTNLDGDPLQLIIDGETITFEKGITAHATSTVVFNVSAYSNLYNRFTTYVGVDSHAAGKGNGVKFSVLTSNDGKEWEEIFVTEPINGNNDAVFIDVDITGVKYLKLYADDNGTNGNDHAVYALPRIMKSDYDLSSERPEPTLPFDERLVQYVYLSDIGYLSNLSQAGWGNIATDTNLNNEKISLLIDGETVAFDKGLTAHATSTLVFNVSDYSQIYNRFTTYVGVDSSQAGRGNGVKFSVLTSNDGKEWEEIFVTEPINGSNNAIFIDVDITGVKYLKLYAHDNGSNGNDHAVYAAPRVMKADYDLEKEHTTPSNPYEDAVLKYIYLSDLGYVTSMSKTAWRNITLDTNLDGGPITLNIDGQKLTFDKGITAHATSTVVFDVSKYSDTYSRFMTYAGVDSSQAGRGNGVKFSVFTSNDGEEWEEIFVTEPINGNNDTVFIDVDITGVKYLKLYAHDNGSNGNDHAVYAATRILLPDYDITSEYLGGVHEVSDYD